MGARDRGRGALRTAALAGLLAVSLVGCARATHEPPNDVDAARLAAVQADPLLGAGGVAEPATTDTMSSNFGWFRATVRVRAEADAPPAEATPDEEAQHVRTRQARASELIEEIRAAGWLVTWSVCDAPGPEVWRTTWEGQAFREMDAEGGPFEVALQFRVTSDEEEVVATLPYHLDPADPFDAPEEGLAAGASCWDSAEPPQGRQEEGLATEVSSSGGDRSDA